MLKMVIGLIKWKIKIKKYYDHDFSSYPAGYSEFLGTIEFLEEPAKKGLMNAIIMVLMIL